MSKPSASTTNSRRSASVVQIEHREERDDRDRAPVRPRTRLPRIGRRGPRRGRATAVAPGCAGRSCAARRAPTASRTTTATPRPMIDADRVRQAVAEGPERCTEAEHDDREQVEDALDEDRAERRRERDREVDLQQPGAIDVAELGRHDAVDEPADEDDLRRVADPHLRADAAQQQRPAVAAQREAEVVDDERRHEPDRVGRDDVRDELVELEPRQRDREQQQDEDRDDDRQLRAPVAQSLRRSGSRRRSAPRWTSGSSTIGLAAEVRCVERMAAAASRIDGRARRLSLGLQVRAAPRRSRSARSSAAGRRRRRGRSDAAVAAQPLHDLRDRRPGAQVVGGAARDERRARAGAPGARRRSGTAPAGSSSSRPSPLSVCASEEATPGTPCSSAKAAARGLASR